MFAPALAALSTLVAHASAGAPPPRPAVLVEGARALAVGDRHACAVTRDGGLACWGDGRFSQLGAGRERSRIAVTIVGVDDATAVAAGLTTTCLRRQSGEVACMGADFAPMIDEVIEPIVPVPVEVVAPVAYPRSLAVGGRRAAVATASGEVWFFSTPTEAPIPKPGVDDAVEVAVGWENVCARRAGGGVRCFGPNYGGENGDGGDGEDVDWVDVVAPVTPTAEILASSYHGCSSTVPAVVDACGRTLAGAVDLAMYGRMACVALDDGRVACWGAGPDDAPLGLGGLGFSRAPIFIPGVSGAVEVAVGSDFVCARDRAGAVSCWGGNAVGQLGRTGAASRAPTRVKGLGPAVELGAGDRFACARDEAGAVSCWGDLPGEEERTSAP